MKRYALLFACLLSGCGNGNLVEAVHKDVVIGFLDPEGARFTETRVTFGTNSRFVCGLVNGKNAFGAYVGAKRYWGRDLGDGLVATHIVEDRSETPCEAYEKKKRAVAADEAARAYEDKDFEKTQRELTCATGGPCLDENGLINSL